MSSLKDIAVKAFAKKGIKATTEKVNAVVASLRVSGVDLSDVKAVTASADVAVEASLKFNTSELFAKLQAKVGEKKQPVATKSVLTNFCGKDCPRCGKPLVYAHIQSRDVGYCTHGCNIAVPFPVKE